MYTITIRSADVARSVCMAVVANADLDPGESLVLAAPGQAHAPWSVELDATDEEVRITAYGPSLPTPEVVDVVHVPYPPGPRLVVMLEAGFCGQVCNAAHSAFEALASARAEVGV